MAHARIVSPQPSLSAMSNSPPLGSPLVLKETIKVTKQISPPPVRSFMCCLSSHSAHYRHRFYSSAHQYMYNYCLAVEICIAETDARECPWYAVYSCVLRDYTFRNGDGGQHIYSVIPQYSLVVNFDSGHSIKTVLLDLGIASSRGKGTP